MGGFLTVLIIIGCIGLILFVLVQNPKGGGLNSEFGSAVQLGGAKRATDILEKGTWGLAILLAVVCLTLPSLSFDSSTEEGEVETSADEIIEFGAEDGDNVTPSSEGFQLPQGPAGGQSPQ
jgi:preprotein translocase subunit SecG